MLKHTEVMVTLCTCMEFSRMHRAKHELLGNCRRPENDYTYTCTIHTHTHTPCACTHTHTHTHTHSYTPCTHTHTLTHTHTHTHHAHTCAHTGFLEPITSSLADKALPLQSSPCAW